MASPPDPLDHARLIVDLDALAANFHTLRDLSGGAEVAPVVKAQGYGMGAEATALRLWAEGARSFFTARVSAGEALRTALGPSRPAAIYIFDGCQPDAAPRLSAANLIPALASLEDVARWRDQATKDSCLKAVLHAETGLSRLGLSHQDCEQLAKTPSLLEGLEVEMVMSHLACGADPDHPLNARQLAAFHDIAALFPDTRASLSASGGILLGEAYRFDLVRPGVALYGGGPRDVPDPRLKTVAVMEAQILALRDVMAGESVGYGADWTARRQTRLAILGAGYADAILRSNFPGGAVWFDGALRPFVGKLSMDLAAIDVTGADAKPGDWVELFGENLPVETAARNAGTLCYELLTGLGARTPRIYRGGSQA